MIDESLLRALDEVVSVSPLLIASDYDGVLAPIVDDPAAAFPDMIALGSLEALGRSSPSTHAVAISGRSLATLRALTGDRADITLVGTHGAEEAEADTPLDLARQVTELQNALTGLAKQYPGAEVEHKPIGAAFHYRHVVAKGAAAAGALQVAAAAGARTIPGKMVVECIFGDANKGVAIERLRNRFGAAAVVYLGDDTTDEDAFAVLGDGDVGIKVGPGETLARYRVPEQQDVAAILGYLRKRLVSQN